VITAACQGYSFTSVSDPPTIRLDFPGSPQIQDEADPGVAVVVVEVVVVLVVVVVVLVVVVDWVVLAVVVGEGASELTAVGDGEEGAGSDPPGGEGAGGCVGTMGPTSSTSQLQSQPHSTGSCNPAWPRAAVRSDTDPFNILLGFDFFFLFRLLPATGGWPSAISVSAPISPDTIAITYSAAILQPQLQPQPISADLAPPGCVVVMVSTVTCPVTATVVVVGAGVVVCAWHSLQLSQFFTSPSPPTAVAHQGDPWNSRQLNCSLGGDDP